jgi:hypothetical protein
MAHKLTDPLVVGQVNGTLNTDGYPAAFRTFNIGRNLSCSGKELPVPLYSGHHPLPEAIQE